MDITELMKKLRNLEKIKEIYAVLIFGSYAYGNATQRSDVDICLVMPNVNSKIRKQIANFIAGMLGKTFDVKVFEFMPLYLKMEVIRNHKIVFARNILDLYEYFYFFRKIWKDQEYRQKLNEEDFRIILQRISEKIRVLKQKMKKRIFKNHIK